MLGGERGMIQRLPYYNKIVSLLSKYYYFLFFILCLSATVRDYLILTRGAEPAFIVFALRLLIYAVVLLYAWFIRIFLKPYEERESFGLAQILILLCTAVLLWTAYTTVFAVSLAMLFAILLRKRNAVFLLGAAAISVIGVYFTPEFVFLMIISGIVVLLHEMNVFGLFFLIVDSLILGIYVFVVYDIYPMVDDVTILLAFFFAYFAMAVYLKSSSSKRVIMSVVVGVWGVLSLYLFANFIRSLSYMPIIITFVASGHVSRDPLKLPSLDEVFEKNKRPLLCFFGIYCIPIITMIIQLYSGVNSDTLLGYGFQYGILQYYISWSELGFIQRGLIGEILKLIFGHVIPIDRMIHIAMTIHLVCLILLIFFMVRLYRSSHKGCIASRLAMFILAGTVLYPYLFTMCFRTDLVLSCITLACVLLCVKNNAFVWFIPLLSVVALLIHPAYGFLIFSPVFISMCYRAWIKPEQHNKRNVAVLMLTTFLVISLFIFFSFFSYRFAKLSVYEASQNIVERAGGWWYDEDPWLRYDPETDTCNLFSYLLYADPNVLNGGIKLDDVQTELSHLYTLKRLVLYIPLLIYYFYIYFSGARQYTGKWKRYLCYLLPFTILTILPLYIWEVDWGRWNLHLILSLIISMQIPSVIDPALKRKDDKERTPATFIFLISEFASIIVWYA